MAAEIVRNRPRDLFGRTMKDLMAWLTRRPITRSGDIVIGHSSTLRINVFLLVGMEILVEGLMDVKMIPPAARPFHFLWMALMIDFSTIFAALTKRNPHRVTASSLHIRAGLYHELILPLGSIRTVSHKLISANGHGVRPIPDQAEAVICNITGTAEIALDLTEPIDLHLANGSRLTARRLYITADLPSVAREELVRAVREANSGSE